MFNMIKLFFNTFLNCGLSSKYNFASSLQTANKFLIFKLNENKSMSLTLLSTYRVQITQTLILMKENCMNCMCLIETFKVILEIFAISINTFIIE